MLIKSISHSSHRASIKNLIAYTFGDRHMTNEHGESVTITNLLRGSRSSWAQQFERVESRRRSFYGGKEVRYYHEILSFSPHSKPTKTELEDLIWKYLELRLDAPTLAFSTVHFSVSHYHAHVIIHGIDKYGKSIRKSKQAFKEDVQVSLNQYQQKYHPRLCDSLIDYSQPSKNKAKLESDASRQRKDRTGESSHKETLNEILSKVFIEASSPEAFVAELAFHNIDVYYRRDVLTGIVYQGRKYRLRKTLGIDFEQLLKPKLRKERLERLRTINKEQTHTKNQER